MSRTALAMGAILALGLAAPAGAVTIAGNRGYAAACYHATIHRRTASDAIELCSTALQMERLNTRDRAATYVNRGILHLRGGAVDNAMTDFDAAIAIDPDLAEGHVNRGAAYLRQQNYAAAVDAISTGLQLSPVEPAQALYNRAVAYEELGNLGAAYRDYRSAAEMSPSWGAPRRELARFQVR